MRWAAVAAFAGLMVTLLFLLRGGPVGTRVMAGIGGLLLLAALGFSFAAQSNISRALARLDEAPLRLEEFGPGALAPWLLVCGLGALGIGALIAAA
jgi:hypothetical protein